MVKVHFTLERIEAFKCEINPKTNQLKHQSFLWDMSAPGLGLCVNRNGIKSFIFRAKLDGKDMRITIGSPDIWSIQAAQTEAYLLNKMIESGQDLCRVKANGLEAEQAARDAKKVEKLATQMQVLNESITFGDVWSEYVKEHSPKWSKNNTKLHKEIMQTGGELKKTKQTGAGSLDALASLRLIDLTMERMEACVKIAAISRPSSGRQVMQILYTCLNWCAAHAVYGAIMTINVKKNTKARETLTKAKAKVKRQPLQPEQLAVWFDLVKKIRNPVSGAYLQCLLLTGADHKEMANLRWVDIDVQQNSLKLNDTRGDCRIVPLTPYVAHLLTALPRRNEWVFSSLNVRKGKLGEPNQAYNEVVALAGLKGMTLQGLRHNFASLCEWIETPVEIVAQIQGLAPQRAREQEYIRRPLVLLRMWHIAIETWMLEQAQINFSPIEAQLLAIA